MPQEPASQFDQDTMHFVWNLTDACNSKCIHCVAGIEGRPPRKDLPVGEIRRMADDFHATLKSMGRNSVFCWSGGEPLIRKDVFKIIEYCARQGYAQEMITNGTLIDADTAQRLRDGNLEVMFISLESVNPKIHDTMRGIKGGHYQALRGIENCKKAGLNVVANMSMTKLNYKDYHEFKHYCENTLEICLYSRFVRNQGTACQKWEEVGLSKEEFKGAYLDIYGEMLELIRQGKATQILPMSIFDLVPLMEVPRNAQDRDYLETWAGCQACKHLLGVDVNGDVSACKYPMGYILGNMGKMAFEEIMASDLFRIIAARKSRHGRCGRCEHLGVCGGGCLLDVFSTTRDPLGEFEYCWHDSETHTHQGEQEYAEQFQANWPVEMEHLMKEVFEIVPRLFRSGAVEVTKKRAEDIASEDTKTSVERPHLARAIMDMTPVPYRKAMIEHCTSLGFDLELYGLQMPGNERRSLWESDEKSFLLNKARSVI